MLFKPSQLAIATHCALFLLVLPVTHANAESSTQATENQASMERMIITGSRSAERIEEVPSSVTLIEQQTLAQDMLMTSQLQNLLAFRVPGLAPNNGTSRNPGQNLSSRAALVMIDGRATIYTHTQWKIKHKPSRSWGPLAD